MAAASSSVRNTLSCISAIRSCAYKNISYPTNTCAHTRALMREPKRTSAHIQRASVHSSMYLFSIYCARTVNVNLRKQLLAILRCQEGVKLRPQGCVHILHERCTAKFGLGGGRWGTSKHTISSNGPGAGAKLSPSTSNFRTCTFAQQFLTDRAYALARA